MFNVSMGTGMSRCTMRKRLREVLGPLLALVLGLVTTLCPATALAANTVLLGVRLVFAGNGPPPAGTPTGPPPANERSQTVLPRFQQLFRYPEYTWLNRHRAAVAVGATQKWDVPGGRRLEVTPERVSGGAVRMRVRLARGSVNELTTNIEAASGHPAVIGGPPFGDGVLIIIVWAHTDGERR